MCKSFYGNNNTTEDQIFNEPTNPCEKNIFTELEYGTGGNLGWEYYKSMAYTGMFQVDTNGKIATEIDTFKELVPIQNDRQAIADIIMNEKNGNNDAQGTKCD